jgi:hypothetical protein
MGSSLQLGASTRGIAIALLGNWFLCLGAIGIITVSLASSFYVWQQVEAYQLHKKAERFCYTQTTDYTDEDERWVAVRNCVNGILGSRKTEQSSVDTTSLETKIEEIESMVQSQIADLRSEIVRVEADASLRHLK